MAELFTYRDTGTDLGDVVLGTMKCTYFDFAKAIEEGVPLFDLLDGHADVTGEMHDALFFRKGTVEPRAFWREAFDLAMGMLYVDRLWVEPAVRSAGIATTLMRVGLPMLSSGAIATLAAVPIDGTGGTVEHNVPELTRKLRRLYRRFGFRQIPNAPAGYLWFDPNRDFWKGLNQLTGSLPILEGPIRQGEDSSPNNA
ncbi:MAG: hypothetical protein M0Z66_10850 [Thermaerobacter sp.]|nr:hypothetical protein [Thermaerobacter sp.]